MTGAGSSTVAFAKEDSYLGSLTDSDTDGNPEYYQPFKNPTVSELSLSNALTRERDPGDVEPDGSLAQNFEGAVSISGELANASDVHDLIFNDGGTGFTKGRMPSSTWFFGLDYLDGTTEWAAKGAIVTQATINYQQGQNVTMDLQLVYGDAADATSITPSSIISPTIGDVQPFHGLDITIDGATVTKEQSATLTIPTNARFHRGSGRHPVDAVIGNVDPTLTTEAIFTGPTNLEAAMGGTTPASMLSEVSGSLAFTNGNGTTVTYNLGGMKPNNYSWASLVDGNADTTEPVDWHVSSVGVA